MNAGFQMGEVRSAADLPENQLEDLDQEIEITERLVRAFMRSIGVNENTISKRLGAQSPAFFRSVLPKLLEHRILVEVPFRGDGNQRRFRLGVQLDAISKALENSGGQFEKFLALATGESR